MQIELLLYGVEDRDMYDKIISKKPDTFYAAYEVAHKFAATRYTSDAVKARSQATNLEATHALLSASLQTKQNKPHYKRASSRGRGRSPVKMHLKPGATPAFTRAREISLALRDRCAKEIEKKIVTRQYFKIEYSE